MVTQLILTIFFIFGRRRFMALFGAHSLCSQATRYRTLCRGKQLNHFSRLYLYHFTKLHRNNYHKMSDGQAEVQLFTRYIGKIKQTSHHHIGYLSIILPIHRIHIFLSETTSLPPNVGVRSVYTPLYPDTICEIALGMLLLFFFC